MEIDSDTPIAAHRTAGKNPKGNTKDALGVF